MDISTIFTLKRSWKAFCSAHPELGDFLSQLRSRSINGGSGLRLSFSDTDGQTLETELKLSSSDMEMIRAVLSVLGHK